MAKEVKIPKVSEDADSIIIEELLVSVGDTIEKEQSIITLETDKASVEVPSSDGGKVKEIKLKKGDEVMEGDVILILENEGDQNGSAEKKEEKNPKQKKNTEIKEKEEKAKKEEPKEEEKKNDEKTKEKINSEDKVAAASPAIRRLARELGVEITDVEGSGPGNRIREEDVKAFVKDSKGMKQASKGLKLPDFSKWGEVEKKALSSMRKSIAKGVTASWKSIPHVFQFDQADISGIKEYMQKNSEKVKEAGGKLTITSILLKIVADALQQFPKFNGSVDMEKEEMILKKYIHISIAVDTEKGLLLPVIRDVNTKNVVELSVELTEIAKKAREQELTLEEMQGGNFSISNLGGIGGTNFTPIIYHPQVAILGVSRAETKPVYIDGNFEPRQILPLSLSYDHRLIDGAEGVEFLRWICQALEDPYKALLGA